MGRLFDEEELKKYIMHDGCDKGCGYIDERDLKYISPVEAIPKDQYEARLKSDLVAILEEINLEMSEQSFGIQTEPWEVVEKLRKEIIQQKINALKAESENE